VVGELADGGGVGDEALEDGAARGVAERFELGRLVSLH
jgi:hypothetical protein